MNNKLTTIHFSIILIWTVLNISSLSLNAKEQAKLKVVENLWNEQLDFSSITGNSKATVIIPFSPATCGYCLGDGWFLEKNYLERNIEQGGLSFYQSLFNPQLDIYAYLRHFKAEKRQVLTYPPDLHNFHRDGFPFIMAFRDGIQIERSLLWPFPSQFDSLKSKLWNKEQNIILTGDNYMVMQFIEENRTNDAIVVYDDNRLATQKETDFALKTKSFSIKHFRNLEVTDLKKSIEFRSNDLKQILKIVGENELPFQFIEDSIISFGPYQFELNKYTFEISFPNPHNPSKFIYINTGKQKGWHNWYDYAVFDRNGQTVLTGIFDKTKIKSWSFTEKSVFPKVSLMKNCEGKCDLPQPLALIKHRFSPTISNSKNKTTIGGAKSVFPDIKAISSNSCWVTWESEGDILAAKITNNKVEKTINIENNDNQSYNPVVELCNGKIWVFYLQCQNDLYRVCGRNFDGQNLSREIIVSEINESDAITLSVASNEINEITVAWSEWQANNRLLKSRRLIDGALDSIKPIQAVPSNIDYVDQWWPNLSYNKKGEVWCVWNQHYPASLTLCGGRLNSNPLCIPYLDATNWNKSEEGGYGSIVFDGKNCPLVFWESSASKSLFADEKQTICYSKWSKVNNRWMLSEKLPNIVSEMNQTPVAALDKNGDCWVAWSGRSLKEGSKWGIFLARLHDSKWSNPIRISPENANSRAPKLKSSGSALWLAWHEGEGKSINIVVKRIVISKQ
ncbi:MAG: hypothetical protein ACOYOT_06165 [Bacteroidales bacterium]